MCASIRCLSPRARCRPTDLALTQVALLRRALPVASCPASAGTVFSLRVPGQLLRPPDQPISYSFAFACFFSHFSVPVPVPVPPVFARCGAVRCGALAIYPSVEHEGYEPANKEQKKKKTKKQAETSFKLKILHDGSLVGWLVLVWLHVIFLPPKARLCQAPAIAASGGACFLFQYRPLYSCVKARHHRCEKLPTKHKETPKPPSPRGSVGRKERPQSLHQPRCTNVLMCRNLVGSHETNKKKKRVR